MSRKIQLWIIVLVAIGCASLVSQLTARLVNFRTEPVSDFSFGDTNLPIRATVAGSSLTFYGFDWTAVSRAVQGRMRGWGVPGGSVAELEVLQRHVPPVQWSFLGVSINDL